MDELTEDSFSADYNADDLNLDKLKKIWDKALEILQREVTSVSYDLWIKSLEPFDMRPGTLFLSTTSATAKQQVLKLHRRQIIKALQEVDGEIGDIRIYDIDEKEALMRIRKRYEEELLNGANSKSKENADLCKFNPKYTFDTFVVGNSNKYVYAAARGVAESPYSRINPLFIYGGVGLGKTHLLHAIGNYIRKHSPNLRVLYVTCEQFTNDYVESLKSGDNTATGKFREKYRNLDVLMIDDIQFISNKTSTQEEFFHTFNDLYQNGKQVVLASDRSPKDIATLEDRLRSRFSMGLIQDIQSPDFETRYAILKKKVELERLNVYNDVVVYIAENCDTNIREMEGILSKVCFYASLSGKTQADMDDVEEALKDHVSSSKPKITGETVIDCTCKYFNVSKEDLTGKKKNKEIVEPRQICMYIMTEILDLPLTSIGSLFGGRDHTTVIHAREKISGDLKNNPRLKTMVEDIKNMAERQ